MFSHPDKRKDRHSGDGLGIYGGGLADFFVYPAEMAQWVKCWA